MHYEVMVLFVSFSEAAVAVNQCTAAVQDYITRRLQAEHDQIEEDERLVRQYREETEKMRSEIDQLKTTYDEFY